MASEIEMLDEIGSLKRQLADTKATTNYNANGLKC